MKQMKRILALLLAVLCFCMIPLSAFAETLDEVSAVISTEQETEESTAVVPPQESETAPEPGAASTATGTDETPPVAPAEDETEQPAETTQPEQEYVPGFEVVLPGGAYVWPVPSSTTVSQGYGSGVHDALDIAAAEGEAVLVAEAGTVKAVQKWDGVSTEGNQSYGNMVQISHEDGNTTLYAHLSETLVSEGETVERGQRIGSIGRTGNVTGPHLHFEVRTATGRVDPTGYITGEDAYEPQDGGSVMRIPCGTSKMSRALGERGRLRVLYYTMTEGVTVSTQTMGSLSGVPAHSIIMADGKTQKAAYCLQSERGATEGNGYTWETAEQTGQSDVIGTIIALGFQYVGQPTGSPPTPWGRGDSNDKWLVTQLLVWAATKGHITIGKNHLINFEAAVDADMAKVAPYTYNSANFLAYYRQLKQRVIDSRKIPSFASYPPENGIPATEKKVINLKWDGSQYSAMATDKNEILGKFHFEETLGDVDVLQDGNTMSLTSPGEISQPVSSEVVTYKPQGGRDALACWRTTSGDTSQQDFAVYTDGYDPVHAIITVATSGVPTGDASLMKTSEDGIVGGISFTISGSDGSSVTKTTDSSGSIALDDLPIYEETPVLDDDGNPVLDELTGDPLTEKGEVITYTASEHTPVRYVRPASQSFTLDSGAVELHFNNRLKKWRVTVTKSDRETGAVAQGDASLAGAVYGVYHNGILQDSYTTDSSGRFTSKYYVCGTGWTLKEITPSEGYLLNTGTEQIGLRPEETSIEYNSTSKGVKEQVIKGRVGITKHTDDGSTQIETPETGAEFQVYLSASGSFNAAKATERDVIVIGENGYGETQLLPYGMYTVHQTKGWAGKEKVLDFQVFISEDGHTYPFIINNRVFEALIQIVKKDSETGRVIPASGIGFKIKDLTSGKWVSQHINYPTPMDLSIFYTDVTGRLMLPSPLTYGQYELYEQQSAYGYVLSKDPVPFVVDGTAKEITVEMGNAPQKGKITIDKHGEVFSSVKEKDGVYQPVYEEQGLPGAVYALYADEDIKTPDGTLRYPVGTLIEQVETDEHGSASFPAVYLGKYTVKEVTAPHGYVLDPTLYHVEFTYAGQEISLQTQTLDCHDERQKVEVSLQKTLEQDETYGIGMNGEYEAVRFGLFAAENLRAADGKMIPKDGMIEEISLTEALTGRFESDLPFGSYYVREFATDDHYILSEETYPVNFEYAGQKKAVVKLSVNDGETIENTLKRGKLVGHKTDEDGLFLAGAVFGLFPVGTTEFSEETALATAESLSNGDFTFENLPVGTWLLRELSAPEAFVLSQEIFEVEITEDGQEVEVEAENIFIKGNVTLTKVDEDYPENKLSGAVFAVYADSDIDGKFTKADVKIGVLEETEPGVCGMENLRYGGYFCVEEKAPEYFILDSTPRFFEIRNDAETVTVANNGECLVNRPQTGSLKIVKTSEDGKVAGVGFRVTGKALTGQSYDKTFMTDENGAIFIPDLRIGSYTVSEVGTDNTIQYVLPADQVAVVRSGETMTVSFYNRLKRGDITGKKIGQDKKPLANVVFGLFLPETTDFSMKNAIATAETDSDGVFLFHDVPYGKYLVKELSTLPGYVLLKDPLAVEITKDGEVIELGEIVNEHTKVQISKQDMTTGKELPGARLELLDPSGKVLETWVSGTDPHLIERLPAGEYVLHEETAPNGYLVSEDVKFTMLETGEIQRVVMKDAPKPMAPNTGENRTIVYVSGAFVLALIGAYVCAILLRRERRKRDQ